MNKLATFVIDSLAVYRLTKLVIDDYITEDLREAVFSRFSPQQTKIGYLFTCPWCVSIWAGATVFGLRAVDPAKADWLSGVLAASAVTGKIYEKGL